MGVQSNSAGPVTKRTTEFGFPTTPNQARDAAVVLARFQADVPTPCVLSVVVSVPPLDGLPANTSMFFPAGMLDATWTDGVLTTFACLRISYGADGGIPRQMLCDLRSGTFQLPPCRNASVDLLTFREDDAVFTWTTCADFTPGNISTAIQPTYTATWEADAAGSKEHPIPEQAVAFDLHATNASGGVAGAFSAVVSPGYVATNTTGLYIRRDYANATFFPMWGPVDLPMGNGKVTVTRATGDECALQFFLEF